MRKLGDTVYVPVLMFGVTFDNGPIGECRVIAADQETVCAEWDGSVRFFKSSEVFDSKDDATREWERAKAEHDARPRGRSVLVDFQGKGGAMREWDGKAKRWVSHAPRRRSRK